MQENGKVLIVSLLTIFIDNEAFLTHLVLQENQFNFFDVPGHKKGFIEMNRSADNH